MNADKPKFILGAEWEAVQSLAKSEYAGIRSGMRVTATYNGDDMNAFIRQGQIARQARRLIIGIWIVRAIVIAMVTTLVLT